MAGTESETGRRAWWEGGGLKRVGWESWCYAFGTPNLNSPGCRVAVLPLLAKKPGSWREEALSGKKIELPCNFKAAAF